MPVFRPVSRNWSRSGTLIVDRVPCMAIVSWSSYYSAASLKGVVVWEGTSQNRPQLPVPLESTFYFLCFSSTDYRFLVRNQTTTLDSLKLFMHGHKVETVPGLFKLAVLDPYYRDTSELRWLICSRKTKRITCMSAAD